MIHKKLSYSYFLADKFSSYDMYRIKIIFSEVYQILLLHLGYVQDVCRYKG